MNETKKQEQILLTPHQPLKNTIQSIIINKKINSFSFFDKNLLFINNKIYF